MRTAILWILALAGSLTVQPQTINFDACRPGQMPPSWSAVSSGSKWEVSRDDTAPSKPYVLAQKPDGGQPQGSSLIVWNNAYFKDGDVSVKFKPVAGREERSGGLVWRYRDPKNYYVLDADATNSKVVLSKVQNGIRAPLAPRSRFFAKYALNRTVPAREWSILHVKIRGPRYIVYFDHREVFEVDDATFMSPGKAGLWTNADSITYFDDFQAKPK
jgi:hypothetical protein